jgi:hypothetical protein
MAYSQLRIYITECAKAMDEPHSDGRGWRPRCQGHRRSSATSTLLLRTKPATVETSSPEGRSAPYIRTTRLRDLALAWSCGEAAA